MGSPSTGLSAARGLPSRTATLALLLATACATPSDAPAKDTAPAAAALPSLGAELWVSQNCALCHGADGRSAWWRPGPDLLPNLHEWTAPAMAAYIADPLLAALNLERLDGTGMPGYPHLSVTERLQLAEHVLSLDADGDG